MRYFTAVTPYFTETEKHIALIKHYGAHAAKYYDVFGWLSLDRFFDKAIAL